ncbi:hypothetical protein CW713_03000 [Methanophagales archaeon]|nr:MAG: hypothetical protein CW713_03000 [Methanophagales archaeon]
MSVNLPVWNITDILPGVASGLVDEKDLVLYVFAALILGIIIGGMMRSVAKLVLGAVMLSGFAVLILMLMQKQDILSTVASIVFGIIILVFGLLVKMGKSYVYIKR